MTAEETGNVQWTVWYTDNFDREMPPQVEAQGTGLAQGLLQLWARFLFETVQPDGSLGFSRFHMQWDKGSFVLAGPREGRARLRRWMFGETVHTSKGIVDEADQAMLMDVATTHAVSHLGDVAGERIVSAAAAAESPDDFKERLAQLREITP